MEGAGGFKIVLKNSRICILEGAGGFSPMKNVNELKGL